MTKAGGTPHRRQTLNKLLQRAAVRDAAGRGGSKGASVNTQVDRKRRVYDIAYMWNKKKNLFTKQKHKRGSKGLRMRRDKSGVWD